MRVQFLVEVNLDIEWESWTPSKEWVVDRMAFFHKYTMKSLLNQTFGNFIVLLYCGELHRELTEGYPWHPKIEPTYDFGEAYLKYLEADFVSITRLDSDDLMHREAMAEIKRKVIFSDKRGCLLFNKAILWNMGNRTLESYCRARTPYFTHTFPAELFRNPVYMRQQHYLEFGKSTPEFRELSRHKICVVRHAGNLSNFHKPLMGPQPAPEWTVTNPTYIEARLEDFAVSPEDIL